MPWFEHRQVGTKKLHNKKAEPHLPTPASYGSGFGGNSVSQTLFATKPAEGQENAKKF
jgi:hypothetical protein